MKNLILITSILASLLSFQVSFGQEASQQTEEYIILKFKDSGINSVIYLASGTAPVEKKEMPKGARFYEEGYNFLAAELNRLSGLGYELVSQSESAPPNSYHPGLMFVFKKRK